MRKTNAQFGQDLMVLDYHNNKKNGTYLEIGVHDGEYDNNTYILDKDYNWKGVCVDPFMKNMENRTCQQFNVALGSKSGLTKFIGDGSSVLSGLDGYVNNKEHNNMHFYKVNNFPKNEVLVRKPLDVLKETNLPKVIDYMSLDVEGSEMDILEIFPFDKYCIKYSTIETNNDKNKEKKMESFMKSKGYKFLTHKNVDHVFINDCKYF